MSSGLGWHLRGLTCALSLCAATAGAQVAPAAVNATPPGAKVSAGQLVAEEKAFVAGPEGATLNLVEGASLHLQPGTRLRFGRTFKLPMGSTPDTIIPTRVLMLDSGWMEATLLAKHFALFVEAPRKLRSILLDGSLTAIASEPRSTVAVPQGKALVALDDAWKWKLLPAGQMQIVSLVRPDGVRRAMVGGVDTPVLSRALMLSGAGSETSSTLLAWPAVPQAINYEIQLRGTDGVVLRTEHTTEPRLVLTELAPGQYQIVVRGVDDSGIYGQSSSPLALNVVGLDIPTTASRGPTGSVRLQANQRVNLVGAEGLEVAYLGADEFLPAPKSVGLVARRPISLVLRHKASGETLRLDLEPLTVHAQVSFASHPHSWPDEGLEVAVKLLDEGGNPVLEDFQVTCKVTVNTESVSPTWQRSNSVLRAQLDRPVSPGPWMVRVDVLDGNGASLGMDFSEVAFKPESSALSVTRSR